MSQDDRQKFLCSVSIFAEMDDKEIARLAGDMVSQRFSAGRTIFYQDDPGDALYIIQSGRVRIYVLAEDGQEVSVVLCDPGEFFGELSLLDQLPRSASAVAMEDTVLLVLNQRAFYQHLRTSYQLALNLMLTLSQRLRQTTDEVKSMATLDVSQRIIRKLLKLAQRQGLHTDEGIRIHGRLTQQELASLVGSSRESTNRALRALVRQGLIRMERGRIVLLKPQELERLASTENW